MKGCLLIILLIISGLEPVVAYKAFAGRQVTVFFFQEDLISVGTEELTADGDLPDEEPFCYLSDTLHQNSKVELFIPHCNKVSRGFLNNPFSPPDVI